MNDTFSMDEKLYRAVWPPEIYELFWRRDGSVSSAAFADPKGLSVDRGDYRSDADVISDMNKRFTGRIIRPLILRASARASSAVRATTNFSSSPSAVGRK